MNRSLHPHAFIGTLSLAPLLAVSDSLIKALGMLLVLWAAFIGHAVLLRLASYPLSTRWLLASSLLISVTLISCAELLLQAVALDLYQALGIYLPLLALFCPLANQSSWSVKQQTYALIGYSALTLLLALIREAVGTASLLAHEQWLFGTSTAHWHIDLFAQASAIPLALTLPGGLILLGLLLAAGNALFKTSETATIKPAVVAKEKPSP
jgi:electron transport complex protein RnfE